jgi:hypothetical protein
MLSEQSNKDPLTFVEENRPFFKTKRQRFDQTLGLLGHGGGNKKKKQTVKANNDRLY